MRSVILLFGRSQINSSAFKEVQTNSVGQAETHDLFGITTSYRAIEV